jgi:hypothetical protein
MLKKIEIQLLLANLALELTYACSRPGQLRLRCLLGRSRQWRRCRARLRWRPNLIRHVQPTQATQCLGTAPQILRPPNVKRLARRPTSLASDGTFSPASMRFTAASFTS